MENSRPIAAPICAISLAESEPVEPRHQRRLQAGRDCQGRGGNCSCGSPRFALARGLQDRLSHLLDKQGNPISSLDDILPNGRREKLVADDAVDHDDRCRALADD